MAGPHSSIINEMAGVLDEMNIKTHALRHEVHHVPAPDGVDFMTGGTVGADDDIGFYFRPEVGNNVLLGSVDLECDGREYVDPDDYDQTINEQWEVQMLRANRRLPALGMPHEKKGIVDLYDVSDDWIPIYDRTDLDGFYVATGTSGNQYKNAGSAAQMGDLIEAVEAGHDHDRDVVKGRYRGGSRHRLLQPQPGDQSELVDVGSWLAAPGERAVGLILAALDVDVDNGARWNRWYDLEHPAPNPPDVVGPSLCGATRPPRRSSLLTMTQSGVRVERLPHGTQRRSTPPLRSRQ